MYCTTLAVLINGMFERPITDKLTEYKAVITRMPDSNGFIFNRV